MQIQSLTSTFTNANNFMTLTIKVPNEEERKMAVHWIFDMDRSGSMSTRGLKDQRTRLQHVQHTLINMLEYLKGHSKSTGSLHKVTLIWFDHETNKEECPTLTFEIIADTDLTQWIEMISKVEPGGSTNIGAAINAAEIVIPQAVMDKTVLVFMSDGEPTTGICNHEQLYKLTEKMINRLEVAKPCQMSSIFIGYGASQGGLMEKLANVQNGEYHCIESEEGAGVVYGEIAHNILKEQRKNTHIMVENGEIYNFKTNTWETTLNIGTMATGVERVFHLTSNNPTQLKVTLDYEDYKTDQNLWQHEKDETSEIIVPDSGINEVVNIYNIRQSVLELLAEARAWKQENAYADVYHGIGAIAAPTTPPLTITRQFACPPNVPPVVRQTDIALNMPGSIPSLPPLPAGITAPSTPSTQPAIARPKNVRMTSAPASSVFHEPEQPQDNGYDALKLKLEAKLEYVKKHIRTLHEKNDSNLTKGIAILQMLTDDLFITMESLTRPTGLTNIIARQTSQGRQRAYNTANADEFSSQEHQVSDSFTSPYAAAPQVACIRSMSQPANLPNIKNDSPLTSLTN